MRLKFPMIVLATLTLAAPALFALQRAPYSGVVAFGTSLTDSGNAFALVGGTSTPPDYGLNPFLVPSAPYARGGHHFTNGATWVEQLARALRVPGSAQPAYRSESRVASNYAVGAARACDTMNPETLDLAEQVNQFLTDVGGVAPSDALYAIEIGVNDVRDAIFAARAVLLAGGSMDQAEQAALPALLCAQQAIQTQIATLYQAGARNFLVWTVPDAGLTPAIRSLGPLATQLAGLLAATFNTEMLLPTVQGLELTLGIDIDVLDAFTLLHQIDAAPASFGLTNTTSACVMPNDEPYFCQAADEYLFWDGIHPTRAAHAIVAQEAARVLNQ
jgi:phospholipase/lecithinase/hemolysin